MFAHSGDLKCGRCFQGQQLMDLEHKLTVAKEELEKTALDKVSSSGANKPTLINSCGINEVNELMKSVNDVRY